MNKSLSSLLSCAVVAGASLMTAPSATAAGYPERPVTIVVPYAAGGSNDLVARVLAQALGRELGGSVVVENAAGASGTIGAARTVHAKPDGYTLLLGSNSEISIAQLTNPTLKYDGQRDLVPIQMVGSQPMVLVTGAQSGMRDVDDFLARAGGKAALSYATSGVGTPLHLSGELIRAASKAEMTHVPYKGGAPAVSDLMANQIELGVLVLSTALPHIKSGKLNALGVTSDTRSPAAPRIPALAENKAFASVNMRLWFGVFAPKGLPKEPAEKLSAAIARTLASPEVSARLSEAGVELDPKERPAFAAFIAAETEKYRKIVSEAKIRE